MAVLTNLASLLSVSETVCTCIMILPRPSFVLKFTCALGETHFEMAVLDQVSILIK